MDDKIKKIMSVVILIAFLVLGYTAIKNKSNRMNRRDRGPESSAVHTDTSFSSPHNSLERDDGTTESSYVQSSSRLDTSMGLNGKRERNDEGDNNDDDDDEVLNDTSKGLITLYEVRDAKNIIENLEKYKRNFVFNDRCVRFMATKNDIGSIKKKLQKEEALKYNLTLGDAVWSLDRYIAYLNTLRKTNDENLNDSMRVLIDKLYSIRRDLIREMHQCTIVVNDKIKNRKRTYNISYRRLDIKEPTFSSNGSGTDMSRQNVTSSYIYKYLVPFDSTYLYFSPCIDTVIRYKSIIARWRKVGHSKYYLEISSIK